MKIELAPRDVRQAIKELRVLGALYAYSRNRESIAALVKRLERALKEAK